MDFLEELFKEGALTWEQFTAAVTAKGFKLADLSTGNYVAKKKYDDEVAAKDSSVKELQGQLKDRDKDLKDLQAKLADGNKDNETKVSELTEQLTKLQGEYKTAKTDYENKLSEQAYDFAVREYANGKKFTSEAAKRDFISQMRSAKLQMKDNVLLGASDFEANYKKDNETAFVVEEEKNTEGTNKPTFSKPSAPVGDKATGDVNPFLQAFGFTAN